jgi:hypothetical protein
MSSPMQDQNDQNDRTNDRARQKARGFVLVVVVMALAIVTAVVVGQYSTTRSEAGASIRVEEEIQSRAIAEGCLALLQRYVDTYMQPANPRFDDFDQLLDPNFSVTDPIAGTGADGDEFLPKVSGASATPVVMDGSALPSNPSFVKRWTFMRRGPAGKQGACLMRIEDNSDDGIAEVGTALGATGPREGPAPIIAGGNAAVDNPFRDRDRAIYLTAIGVFPALDSNDANVWKKAHTRTTLRRLYAVASKAQSRPAIKSCGNVDFDNGTTICGQGGIEATGSVDIGGGSACTCGAINGTTVSGNTGACGCCSNPPASSPGSPAVCDPPPAPPPHSHLGLNAFGNPNDETNINLGDKTTCKVFSTALGEVFIWDVTDPAALTTLTNDYGLAPAGNQQDCRFSNGVANHTGTGTSKEIQRPCTWTFTGAGAKPTVSCASAAESLCWKPLAILNQRNDRADFVASNALDFEWESQNKDADMVFYKGVPIPFSKDRSKTLAAATAADTFCGADSTSCPTCMSAAPIVEDRASLQWLFECNGGAPAGFCSDYHAHAHWSNKRFPAPTVFVLESANKKKIQLEQDPADTEPLWMTLNVIRDANMGDNTGMCSAHMPNACKSVPPGMTGKTISSGSCTDGNAQVPASPYAPPTVREPPDLTYPIVYRADPVSGDCTFDKSVTLVGSVECPIINMNNANQCVVGALIGTGTSSSGAMGNCITTECPTGSICIENNFSSANSTLWSVGSICGGNTNAATINADIYTTGGIDFKNSISVKGIIEATGNVFFKNNATINAVGATIVTTGSQGMTSFMECAW